MQVCEAIQFSIFLNSPKFADRNAEQMGGNWTILYIMLGELAFCLLWGLFILVYCSSDWWCGILKALMLKCFRPNRYKVDLKGMRCKELNIDL